MASLVQRLRTTFEKHGVAGTVKRIPRLIRHRKNQLSGSWFDIRYGVHTTDVIDPPAFQKRLEQVTDANGYEPITFSYFERMMEAIGADDLAGYWFVDLGSGLGRALMLASDYPFTRIVGVEFVDFIHEVASDNIQSFLENSGRPDNFELHCIDAAAYPWPDRPTVLFLYNPFGPQKMQQVLDRLADSLRARPRALFILYRNPACRDMFRVASWLETLQENEDFAVYRFVAS
jgi:hypothetical protein